MACKIQLSLQGGGAKIAYLMPALRAIRHLETTGEIEVVRISGTSAGALAGCLYASRLDWNDVEIFVKETVGKLAEEFVLPGKWSIWWRLFFKEEALWQEKAITKKLEKFFEPMKKLRDLQIPMIVLSADLKAGDEHVHDPYEEIAASIMDSCGIPFAFRHKSQRVDGGLCANLPVLHLAEGKDANGNDYAFIPTVALSFPNSSGKDAPGSAKEFFWQLVDTSINSGVTRAKNLADFVCDVREWDRLDISTLDFRKVVPMMENKDIYEGIQGKVDYQLRENFFPRYEEIVSGKEIIQRLQNDIQMERTRIYEIYRELLMGKRRILSMRMEVNLGSFSGQPQKDKLAMTMRFSPVGEPMTALEMQVEVPFDGTVWNLREEGSWESLPLSHVIPHEHQDSDGVMYMIVVIVPKKPLEPGKEYILSTLETCDCAVKLRAQGEELWFYHPQDFEGDIGEVEFVFHYPERNLRLQIAPHENYPIPYGKAFLGDVPKGFAALGAKCQNAGKTGFGINLIRIGS